MGVRANLIKKIKRKTKYNDTLEKTLTIFSWRN